MALDPGIASMTLTFGPYKDATGATDTSWSATVTLDRELFWPSGSGQYSVYEQIDLKVTPNLLTGLGQIVLPVTNQVGFVDSGGSAVSAFSYGISWKTVGYTKRPLSGLALTTSMGTTIGGVLQYDADNYHQGTSAPAPSSSGATYVNSITLNGTTYTGNAVLPASVSGAGTTTVAGITNATSLGQSLLLSTDTNSAQTVLGVQDLRGLITALTTTVSGLQATVTAQAATITTLTASLAGKVNTSAVGVTVAPLDGAAKLPLVNLTPLVSLLIGNGSATIPVRPATPNPVIFDVTGAVVPATGTTAGGSAAGVNGLDRQWT